MRRVATPDGRMARSNVATRRGANGAIHVPALKRPAYRHAAATRQSTGFLQSRTHLFPEGKGTRTVFVIDVGKTGRAPFRLDDTGRISCCPAPAARLPSTEYGRLQTAPWLLHGHA